VRDLARKECTLIVDLNLQTTSSRSRILTRIIIPIIIAALILIGLAPSFATSSFGAEVDTSDAPSVKGTSAIMIDGGTGDILYEKNAYEQRDPASITKILTALVVLNSMNLDDEVTITKDSADTGITINLKKGEVLTVEQLLYAAMLPSANDAAEALAIACGGSVSNFCTMMNEWAEKCGAKDSNFTNPNGLNLYGQYDHKTTAYDIAMIAREAMKNDTFRKIVATTKYTIPATNKSGARTLKSTNPCLYSAKTVDIDGEAVPIKYDGVTGIKTGTTSVAGYCYCGSAKRDDTELIVVTLNSGDRTRFADAIKLWDYGFSKYYTYKAASASEPVGEAKVKKGATSKVSLVIAEDLCVTLNKTDNSDDYTTEIDIDKTKTTAPIKKGEVMGTITVYNGAHKAVASTSVLALKAVSKGGVLSNVGVSDDNVGAFLGVVIAIVILLILLRVYVNRARRKKLERQRAQRKRNVRRRQWDKEKHPFDE
jgi:D-alanyl-D-alanine carboxypeptidase (penicillin-binding protein 5/6)